MLGAEEAESSTCDSLTLENTGMGICGWPSGTASLSLDSNFTTCGGAGKGDGKCEGSMRMTSLASLWLELFLELEECIAWSD